MRKLWHDEAWEEYLYWQSQDKKTLKKTAWRKSCWILECSDR